MANIAIKKRFIAGAVCPACQSMDTIVVHQAGDDTVHMAECVDCGHQQNANAQPSSPTQQSSKTNKKQRKVIWLAPVEENEV